MEEGRLANTILELTRQKYRITFLPTSDRKLCYISMACDDDLVGSIRMDRCVHDLEQAAVDPEYIMEHAIREMAHLREKFKTERGLQQGERGCRNEPE